MTDKVQKIKDWISKEQEGLMDAQGNFKYPEHEGAYHILCNLDAYIDSMQEEPTTSVWHDAKDTPVASKTKIVLYTNGKWDMFKAYENKDDYDNYWAGVNQALEEKGVLVKRWAYVEDLLKL